MSTEGSAAVAAPSVESKRQHREFWVSDAPEDAIRKVKIVLKRIGELTEVLPGGHIAGEIRFGLNEAVLKVAWPPASEPSMNGTMLNLEADCPSAVDAATRETAARSAIERFEEAYYHYDDPDFKPDRLGLPPLAIAGILVLLVLLGSLLLRTRFAQRLLPQKGLTVMASPGAEPSPSANPDGR